MYMIWKFMSFPHFLSAVPNKEKSLCYRNHMCVYPEILPSKWVCDVCLQKNKVEEAGDKGKNEQMGSGRTIPIKQVRTALGTGG